MKKYMPSRTLPAGSAVTCVGDGFRRGEERRRIQQAVPRVARLTTGKTACNPLEPKCGYDALANRGRGDI